MLKSDLGQWCRQGAWKALGFQVSCFALGMRCISTSVTLRTDVYVDIG